jgi:hypothetical protein
MEIAEELRTLFDGHLEWLAVRENGRTLPLRCDEIDVTSERGRTLIGFVDDPGYTTRRIAEFAPDGLELILRTFAGVSSTAESIRFVPRTPAAELAANIELARLEKANDAARIVLESFPQFRAERIQLNTSNGRLAQIMLRRKDRSMIAVLYDVTASVTHESILATALKWLDALSVRKKDPIGEMWIAAEKRQARNLQKLAALLRTSARQPITILEIVRTGESPTARPRRQITIGDLWREKPRKLSIPSEIVISRTARQIIELAPESIDVVFSKQGETLRFHGLPFARVRKVMGRERAWFGVERSRRPLTTENVAALAGLIDELELYRSPNAVNKRHDLYRLASEAWLESILRRNIKLLDANLELSPIYNQFRSSSDKIDLLAIRRDGRLVVIELKTSPDRDAVLQAADYWRKLELQRRRGILQDARLFGEKQILDRPLLVYMAAPALSFHRDWEYFARVLAPEIELWRWELHEDWRRSIKVISRQGGDALTSR